MAGYDYLKNALRTVVTNPDSSKHVEEVLDDQVNVADGTYNNYVDLDEFVGDTFQADLDPAGGSITLKVYGTVQDDGTDAISCSYHDITQHGLDALNQLTAASYTSDVILALKREVRLKYLKIELVVAGAGGLAGYALYNKKTAY
jgi:hypothetical protein